MDRHAATLRCLLSLPVAKPAGQQLRESHASYLSEETSQISSLPLHLALHRKCTKKKLQAMKMKHIAEGPFRPGLVYPQKGLCGLPAASSVA